MNRILSWGGPLDRLGDWALPLLEYAWEIGESPRPGLPLVLETIG